MEYRSIKYNDCIVRKRNKPFLTKYNEVTKLSFISIILIKVSGCMSVYVFVPKSLANSLSKMSLYSEAVYRSREGVLLF